ncbi:hypothetical protein DPMN_167275 [Dreissena polymorpha]|uniref:Uncharacterized protein n=1 Tax=Dreissena polymorpha TaxID=45954 RepID=A0A9D4F0G4_DREPO|nr:hypothetical protein DPMN_167275 [Dreissena polymorpha]
MQDLTAYRQKRLRLTRRPVWSYYTRSSARYGKKKKSQQSGKMVTSSSFTRKATSVPAPTTEESRCYPSQERCLIASY